MILNCRKLSPTLLLTALLAACGGDDDGGDDVEGGATHAQALQAISTSACSIATCHGSSAQGGLRLDNATDLNKLLVGVTACEAPSLKLVEAGDPDKSWLWIKMTAEHDGTGKLKSQSAWGQPGTCAKNPGVGFGNAMPDVSPWKGASDANLDIIESWIQGGAPGPT